MKPFSLLVAVLFLNLAAQAAKIGTLQIAGPGCDVKVGANKLTPVKGSKARFTVPIQISEDKPANLIVRKSCMMSLPVKLNPKEKIQIINPSQTISLRAAPASKASMQTEIFFAGQKGQLLKSEIEAVSSILRVNKNIALSGVIAESSCGGDAILRANSSVLLTGAGLGRAVTQPLALDLKVVNCL